ncbi:MAG: WYL domain-containing protein [Gemmatimonadales bacterium]|nr:MAG: WYL domain-containing protein [Gemmatimonadales bacterium]
MTDRPDRPTPPPGGAIDRLERLLLLLPRAQRKGGVTFDELERLLEVDRRTLRADLDLLTARASYLRAGDPADLQITIDAERVEIFSPGPFHRPPRLGAREALALVLGLRTRALVRGLADTPATHADALLARLEGVLATRALDDIQPLPVEDASARPVDGLLRDRALDAIAERRPVRLRYLKPGASDAEVRQLHPLTLVHAEGRWYLMGEAPDRPPPAVRSFRLDRILEIEIEDESKPFAYPDPFDPHDYLEPSRVFQAADPVEVTVDYSPKIARWIEERFEGVPLEGWGFRVTHPVADREWLVRHVLRYGGEAVAHSPGREWVIEALDHR